MDKLNSLGNPLEKPSRVFDFEMFQGGLTKKGLLGQLFNEFYAFLEENNLILHEGTMIDGSFVEAPRQHNRRRGLGWNMCSGTWKSAFTECPAEWSALRGTRPTTP